MTLLIVFALQVLASPSVLTIQECYAEAEQNFPTVDQIELQDRIAELTQRNLTATSLPSLTAGGQAIYYSDVASFPGPDGPSPPNDQYKLSLLVEQAIYDGGLKSVQRTLTDLAADLEKKRVEVDLFKLREQVNAAFMGALIFDAQIAAIETASAELEARLESVVSLIRNGVLLPSNEDVIRVELLKNEQRRIEAESNRETMRAVLGLLIGRKIDEATVLQIPVVDNAATTSNARLRKEYEAFDLSRRLLEAQQAMINRKSYPLLGAFAETAYGRPPGLNLFESGLTPFYSVGIRMQWKPLDWRTSDREKAILDARRQIIDSQEQAFTTNTAIAADRHHRQIAMLNSQISRDREIIDLRVRITNEAGSRLEEGVLTASDYVTEVNQTTQSRLAMALHELQRVQAQLNLLVTLGEQP